MKRESRFKALLKHQAPIILDGGLATELEANGYDLNTALWSAGLLLNHPQAIVDAHLAYLNAGAQIITTVTYQASINGFTSMGLSEDRAKKLMLEAVELARTAVTRYCQSQPQSPSPLIAASIGPYGACLADGSEYRGDYGVDNQTLAQFHLPRLRCLMTAALMFWAAKPFPRFRRRRCLPNC